jgi:hypothetical protein
VLQHRSHPQHCSHTQRRSNAASQLGASQQHVQHCNNTICNDATPSYSTTFIALSLAIDVSRTLNNIAIATELRGALQHHPQRSPFNFRPTSVGFLSDCPVSLAVEVLPMSLLMSLLT